MSFRELSAISVMLLLSGCLYHARERADATVSTLAGHPYDMAPPEQTESRPALPSLPSTGSDHTPANDQTGDHPPRGHQVTRANLEQPTGDARPSDHPAMDVQTTAYLEVDVDPNRTAASGGKLEPKIPLEIPGSDTSPLPARIPADTPEGRQMIERLFPPLPPLPADPTPMPGPEGRPYTLADLHLIAASNSPELRQAAADVETARGNLIQARSYPNPIVGWQATPSNDGSTAAAQGPFFDQTIKSVGKLKLASAAAEMDLKNSELALKRARSDLATRVRNAYYGLLVAKETVRVTRALARFTDEIYRLQTGLLKAGVVASYEPMALRAQAYTARLAHKQAIQAYTYAWKTLVATIGLRQMPLSEVAGRIDAVIPYFDFDTVLEHALRSHTDVLTARNGVDKARYNLKLAQVTPIPDVDVNVALLQEYAVPPKQFVHSVTVGVPFPIWDRNKGAIIAAEGALVRASEEPHRVELNLTETLSTAYQGYKANLDALEFYRRYILPDQVRAYRGVLTRRQLDSTVAFADVLGQQQTLATDVTNYLGILGSLWTSVTGVADLLQTDDLFQLAQPREVPSLPDLDHIMPWPCWHPGEGPPLQAPPSVQFGDPTLQTAREPARTKAMTVAVPAHPADPPQAPAIELTTQLPSGMEDQATPAGTPKVISAVAHRPSE